MVNGYRLYAPGPLRPVREETETCDDGVIVHRLHMGRPKPPGFFSIKLAEPLAVSGGSAVVFEPHWAEPASWSERSDECLIPDDSLVEQLHMGSPLWDPARAGDALARGPLWRDRPTGTP